MGRIKNAAIEAFESACEYWPLATLLAVLVMCAAVPLVMVVAGLARAAEPPQPALLWTADDAALLVYAEPVAISFGDVTIYGDGRVVLGPKTTPNEAGRAFWLAVSQAFPEACRAKEQP